MEKKLNKKISLINFENLIEFILFRFRWIFILAFILPLSVTFDLYSIIRNWFAFWFKTGLKLHKQKVAQIQQQVI